MEGETMGETENSMEKIDVQPGHHIIGKVQHGMVDVHDIVHGGVSERALTGQKPDISPIPLQTINAIRAKHGMEPHPTEYAN
jgi:hypothetical protein